MTIWYRDLVNFFDISNVLVFYPTNDMVYSEKLNAIMRMIMYVSIILYSLLNDSKVFVMLIVAGIIIYIMYELDDNKEAFERDRYAKYRSEEEGMYAEEDGAEQECTRPTRENPFMNVTSIRDLFVENGLNKKILYSIINKYNDHLVSRSS